jgi:hypothetical protein
VPGTPAPPAAPPPVSLTLTPEQWADYSQMRSRVAELEAAEHRRTAEAQAAEVRALQAKGQIEQAFNLQRQQAEALLVAEREKVKQTEDRAKRYALDGELARALAAQPLVQGGSEQLTQLIRHEFNVEQQGDTLVVRSKDFRSVSDYVATILARPDYAHYLRPNNPAGGSAGTQGSQTAPTGPPNPQAPAEPNTMSDYALWHHQQSIAGAPNPAATGGAVVGDNGRAVPRAAAGFGLRAVPIPPAQRRA